MGGILAPIPLVAEEKGFFSAEGIAADISLMQDGKAAMNAFLEGKCDASLSSEFVVARQGFTRDDLVIIAAMGFTDNAVKILARRDRGISSPRDLAGKRVAVSKGTISHFFLDQFLKKNRIPSEKLKVVDIPHYEVADALNRGDIDAFAGSDFAYLKGKELMGEKGITFSEPGLTNHAACLVVRKAWLAANPETARSVMEALLKGERELAAKPEELAAILSSRLKVQYVDMKSIFAEQHNMVTLDQILLLSLEDEARWLRENGLTSGKTLPNFLRLIDPSVLKTANPKAVKLK